MAKFKIGDMIKFTERSNTILEEEIGIPLSLEEKNREFKIIGGPEEDHFLGTVYFTDYEQRYDDAGLSKLEPMLVAETDIELINK